MIAQSHSTQAPTAGALKRMQDRIINSDPYGLRKRKPLYRDLTRIRQRASARRTAGLWDGCSDPAANRTIAAMRAEAERREQKNARERDRRAKARAAKAAA